MHVACVCVCLENIKNMSLHWCKIIYGWTRAKRLRKGTSRGGKGQKLADTFSRNEELMNSELGILRKETKRFPQDAFYKSRSAWKFPVA